MATVRNRRCKGLGPIQSHHSDALRGLKRSHDDQIARLPIYPPQRLGRWGGRGLVIKTKGCSGEHVSNLGSPQVKMAGCEMNADLETAGCHYSPLRCQTCLAPPFLTLVVSAEIFGKPQRATLAQEGTESVAYGLMPTTSLRSLTLRRIVVALAAEPKRDSRTHGSPISHSRHATPGDATVAPLE